MWVVLEFSSDKPLSQIECYTNFGEKLVEAYVSRLFKADKAKSESDIPQLLSEPKAENSLKYDLDPLYKSNHLHAIAGNIIQFLSSPSTNMIEHTPTVYV